MNKNHCTATPDWVLEVWDINHCCKTHDDDYVAQVIERQEADDKFFECVKEEGVDGWFIMLAIVGFATIGRLFWWRRKWKK